LEETVLAKVDSIKKTVSSKYDIKDGDFNKKLMANVEEIQKLSCLCEHLDTKLTEMVEKYENCELVLKTYVKDVLENLFKHPYHT